MPREPKPFEKIPKEVEQARKALEECAANIEPDVDAWLHKLSGAFDELWEQVQIADLVDYDNRPWAWRAAA